MYNYKINSEFSKVYVLVHDCKYSENELLDMYWESDSIAQEESLHDEITVYDIVKVMCLEYGFKMLVDVIEYEQKINVF